MSQTRMGSFIEAWVNIVIGYTINIFANMAIFPWFGIEITLATNLKMGVAFTFVSLARSYVIRRWFNARIHAASQKLGGGTPNQSEFSTKRT